MTIEILGDGIARVEVRYAVKKGMPGYSSEDCSMSVGLEVKQVGGIPGDFLVACGALEDEITAHLKLGVTSQLGLGLKDVLGVSQPVYVVQQAPATVAPAPVAAAPAGYAAPPAPAPAPAAAGEYGPPKASKEQVAVLPRFQADLGDGVVKTWIDQRSLKADGTYSPKAPDFKNALDSQDSKWLNGANGQPNAAVAAGLAAAAAVVQPPDEAPF